MSVGSNCVSLCGPLILAELVNKIQQNKGIIDGGLMLSLQGILGLFLLLTLATWSLHGPSRVMEMANGFKTRANYKMYLFDGMIALPLKWHSERHSGDLIDKIGKGTTALGDFSEDTFEIIRMAARLVGSYIILIYFNPHSVYIVLATTLSAAMIVLKFDKILIRQYHELNRTENRIAEKITDAINHIETIITLRIENLVSKSVAEKILSPFNLFLKNNKLNELKWFLVSVCAALGKIMVLGSFIYIAYKSHQPILIGSFVALHGYVNEANNLFFDFASIYSQIIRRRTRVANSEEIARDFHLCRKTTNGRLPRDWKELRIENLSFSYDIGNDKNEEDEPGLHLDDISMTIRHGQRIALIGSRGSGKTTFLRIVRELYKPKSAIVYVDGDLMPKGFASISSDVTLVLPNPQIFYASILDNVTMTIDYDIDHVRHFTDMANFSDVVTRLPRGFDSWIHEKGVNLSSGEKQSLALARGLLACEDKEIILLDEPTSNIDTINELEIHRNIFSGFPDKTVISSVHKLHLLPMFDVIHFFDNGKIIASGTFDELLSNSSRFRELWVEYNKNLPDKHV
ncbi:MAG: ABC transporter ATP-binding protein [Candidatus Yanofskybacteria bacterium]|nr:ABC transporter ATP-binding protein [Candidatus Yanofskybacteria bacterium]